MRDVRIYVIQIRGEVEADEINPMSPLHVKVIRVAARRFWNQVHRLRL